MLLDLFQGQPAALKPHSSLRFGASTRTYALQQPQPAPSQAKTVDGSHSEAAGSNREGTNARSRVRFAGSSKNDTTELEKIIGYSDGKSFAVNVGPTSAEDNMQGQFSGLVRPQTLEASITGKSAEQVDGVQTLKARKEVPQADRRSKKAQPLLAPSSSGLYDMLPPATVAKPTATAESL